MTALIIIIITLALVVFICIERNLDAKANEISNKAISIYKLIEQRQSAVEAARKERITTAVRNTSLKIKNINTLNDLYHKAFPKQSVSMSMRKTKRLYSKRDLDKLSLYSEFLYYKSEFMAAYKYKEMINYLNDRYLFYEMQIQNIEVPSEVIKELKIDIDEYKTYEMMLFNKLLIKPKGIYENPKMEIYAEYTSPAGRNHWYKSNTFNVNDLPYKPTNVLDGYTLTLRLEKYKPTTKSPLIYKKRDEEDGTNKYYYVITFNKQKLYRNKVDLKYINISSDVTTIEPYAFEGCTNLKEVIIEGTNVIVENYAFAKCYNITKITCKKGTVFEEKALIDCYSVVINEIK